MKRLAVIALAFPVLCGCGNSAKETNPTTPARTDAGDEPGTVAKAAPADARQVPPPTTPPDAAVAPTQPAKKAPRMRDDIREIIATVEKMTGKDVRRYSGDQIPGMAIVLVESGVSKRQGTMFEGAVLVDGTKKLLRDEQAFRAGLERSKDAMALAGLALVTVDRNMKAEPVSDPSKVRTSGEIRAIITAPRLTSTHLEYWTWAGTPQRTARRSRIDLATLKTESVSGHSLVKAAKGPLAAAKEQLAKNNMAMQRGAIADLLEVCDKVDGAKELLLETMKSHSSAYARTEAGRAVKKCHDKSAVNTLIGILENDSDENVQAYAADTLGLIGDPIARPALEKANQSTSRKVKGAAHRALKKLR